MLIIVNWYKYIHCFFRITHQYVNIHDNAKHKNQLKVKLTWTHLYSMKIWNYQMQPMVPALTTEKQKKTLEQMEVYQLIDQT